MPIDYSLQCVMLIDDDPDDNFLHQLVIQDTGLDPKIITAESGERALNYLLGSSGQDFQKPDIIFLDINMPGMSGFDFLEKYKTLPTAVQVGTKVVMLSTSSLSKDQQKASSILGEIHYHTKPLTEKIIEQVLQGKVCTDGPN